MSCPVVPTRACRVSAISSIAISDDIRPLTPSLPHAGKSCAPWDLFDCRRDRAASRM